MSREAAARPPRLLSIAGSDSGGGAGVQADLKTFAAFGVYGMTAITAITAQNTREITAVQGVEPALVAAQIAAVFDDLGVDAVKIGMLGSAAVVMAVASALARYPPLPVVLDPVMIAKSGRALLDDAGVEALRRQLLPRVTLVTPNLPEAEHLLGRKLEDESGRRAAAKELGRIAGAALIKGGHGEEAEIRDLLFDGERFHVFSHPRLETTSTHGTGCTLAAAIAAGLGAGRPLLDAVQGAELYLHEAIKQAFPLGAGHGPVNHLVAWRR